MVAETTERPYVDDGDATRGRRRVRFAAATIVLVVAIAIIAAFAVSRRQGPTSSEPTPTVVAEVSMFLYPPTLPADGGSIAVVFRNESDTTFVVPPIVDLERATGEGSWERVGAVGLCQASGPCGGGLIDAERATTTANAVLAPAAGVSPAMRVILPSGQGRYRLIARGINGGPGAKPTLGEASPSSAPPIDSSLLHLTVTPVLVPAGEPTTAAVAVSGGGEYGSCGEMSTDGWRLRRWEGTGWSEQPIDAAWTDPTSTACEATVQLPALTSGAWQLVASGADGEVAGPLWVE